MTDGMRMIFNTQFVLATVLKTTLELLHPFMPFLTEDIWQRLPQRGQTIMKTPWPLPDSSWRDLQAEEQMAILMEAIRAIRHIRSEMNVPPGLRAQAFLVADTQENMDLLNKWGSYIQDLARADIQTCRELAHKPDQAAHAIFKGIELFVPLKGLIDIDKEIARLEKELQNIRSDLVKVKGKLSNENFLSKARPEIIEKERGKEEELLSAKSALTERLSILKS